MKLRGLLLAIFITGAFFGNAQAAVLNPEVTAYLQTLEKQARQEDPSFKGFSAERGKLLFFAEQPNQKLGKISCASCHMNDLKKQGKNIKTGKIIDPLSPSANSKSLSSVKNVEKWLKRNFSDVYGREGTAKEKGDSILFISKQ